MVALSNCFVQPVSNIIQLSGGHGRAAEQAYTQRGLVWRLRGEDERALEDFKRAARLGGTFAQKHTCEAPVVAFYGEKEILCILSTMHGWHSVVLISAQYIGVVHIPALFYIWLSSSNTHLLPKAVLRSIYLVIVRRLESTIFLCLSISSSLHIHIFTINLITLSPPSCLYESLHAMLLSAVTWCQSEAIDKLRRRDRSRADMTHHQGLGALNPACVGHAPAFFLCMPPI